MTIGRQTSKQDLEELAPAKPPAVIGTRHIVTSTAIGLVVMAALAYLVWLAARKPDASQWYELGRSVPLLFAAVGAVPAAYVAYRRQRTLETQREDTQAAELQRQKELTDAELRTEAADLRARYGQAAAQLGHDKPAIRLAGVHAMAQLADDWASTDPAQRQICVDVLCAYLCLPLTTTPPLDGVPRQPSTMLRKRRETAPIGSAADPAEIRVRETIVRVIAQHLDETDLRWSALNFDFTGAEFPSGRWDFSEIRLVGGSMNFTRATLTGGTMSFAAAHFTGSNLNFTAAAFASGAVDFLGAVFEDDKRKQETHVKFDRAEFAGGNVNFGSATISGSFTFNAATLTAGKVNFAGADIREDGSITFDSKTTFGSGVLNLDRAHIRPDAAISLDGRPYQGTDTTGKPWFADTTDST